MWGASGEQRGNPSRFAEVKFAQMSNLVCWLLHGGAQHAEERASGQRKEELYSEMFELLISSKQLVCPLSQTVAALSFSSQWQPRTKQTSPPPTEENTGQRLCHVLAPKKTFFDQINTCYPSSKPVNAAVCRLWANHSTAAADGRNFPVTNGTCRHNNSTTRWTSRTDGGLIHDESGKMLLHADVVLTRAVRRFGGWSQFYHRSGHKCVTQHKAEQLFFLG